jgi:PilZ domain
MPDLRPSLDSLECFDPSLMRVPFNRRVSLRYPCGTEISAKVKIGREDPFRSAPGQNISQGGMGVILDECPEVGLIVNIRLVDRVLSFSYELAARIVHVTPAGPGEWLVGLAFSRKLTVSELASLL